jgi:hypothetical protein
VSPASASFSQKLFQFMAGRRQIRPPSRLADSHDNIDRPELITQLAEYFSNRALHQGPCNRAWRRMPADNDSQTGLRARRVISA